MTGSWGWIASAVLIAVGGCGACRSLDLGSDDRELGTLEVSGERVVVTATVRGRRNSENVLGGRASGLRVATEGERWTIETSVGGEDDAREDVVLATLPGWTGDDADQAEDRFDGLALDHCAARDGAAVFRITGLEDTPWLVAHTAEGYLVVGSFETAATDCASAANDAPGLAELLSHDWRDRLTDPGSTPACSVLLDTGPPREALLCGIVAHEQRFRDALRDRLASGEEPALEGALFALARPGGLPALGDPEQDESLARHADRMLPIYIGYVPVTERTGAFVDQTLESCVVGTPCEQWRLAASARIAAELRDAERCDRLLERAREWLAEPDGGAARARAATVPLSGRCGSDELLTTVLVEALAHPTLDGAAQYPDCYPRFAPSTDLLTYAGPCGSFPRIAGSHLARGCPDAALERATELVAQWAPDRGNPADDEVLGGAMEVLGSCAPERATELAAEHPELAREVDRFRPPADP